MLPLTNIMLGYIMFIGSERMKCVIPATRHGRLCMTAPEKQSIDNNDEDNLPQTSDEISTKKNDEKKAMSPLAMAAADWLEEEEDELAMYWDRFDAAKSSSSKATDNEDKKQNQQQQQIIKPPHVSSTKGETTEQLLDRYYESRGIDKGEEKKYATQIRLATEAASKTSSPEEALRLFEPIQQYLQFNTKVGGNAYFEMAQALDAASDGGRQDEATDIYKQLAASPHVDIRRKSREILSKSPRPKRVYNKNVWNIFWNKWE